MITITVNKEKTNISVAGTHLSVSAEALCVVDAVRDLFVKKLDICEERATEMIIAFLLDSRDTE